LKISSLTIVILTVLGILSGKKKIKRSKLKRKTNLKRTARRHDIAYEDGERKTVLSTVLRSSLVCIVLVHVLYMYVAES